MVSFSVRHVSDAALTGGRVLASRRKGAASGRMVATRRTYGARMSYLIDEQNGSQPVSVPVVFPSATYSALGYTPSRTGYRFLGWFDAASGGSAVPADGQVAYGAHTVYAHWQDHVTVAFDATTNGGSMPAGWTAPYYFAGQEYGMLPTPTHASLNFGGWYDGGGNRVTASSIVPQNGASLTARYVNSSYTVDLNGGDWALGDPNSPITGTRYVDDEWWNDEIEDWDWGYYEEYSFTPPANPDSSAYDGVYMSMNAGRNSSTATMYITCIGYSEFTVLVRTNGEDEYDYVTIGCDTGTTQDDTDFSYASNSGTSLSDYRPITFSFANPAQNVIEITYSKDSSVDEGADRAFVLIPKVQGGGS